MKGRLFGIFLLQILIFTYGNAMAAECVVLIHGFGRSSFSLNRVSSHLSENGYKTILVDYPSRKYQVFQLAEQFVLPEILPEIQNCSKVHFVGYSMGGIITRYILNNHRPKNLGRVVLIASPNSGVEVVNALGKYEWFKTIFGPAVQELAVGGSFITNLSPEVDYETGVISGNFSVNPFTSIFLIPGEDDGTISVETTKIKGMKDHIIVNSSHSMLLYNQEVVEEVEHFISKGKFRH